MLLQELHVRMGLLIDEFQKNSERVKQEANTIESRFKALKGGLAALGVFAFMRAGLEEFAEYDEASNKLGMRLQRLGGNWQENKEKLLDYAGAMAKASGMADDQLVGALDNLVAKTEDTNTSMALLQDAMDIAVDKGMNVKDAAEMVGRAYNGEQRSLSQLGMMYGIARDDADDYGTVISKVRGQTKDIATSQDNLRVTLNKISEAWKDLQQNIGQALAPLLTHVPKILNWTGDILRWASSAAVTTFKNFPSLVKVLTGAADKKEFDKVREAYKGLIDQIAGDMAKGDEKATAVARVTQGKHQKWMSDKEKALTKEHQAEEAKRIKASEQAMRNRVRMGQATEKDLLALMEDNSEKIRELWGKDSEEFAAHEQEKIAVMEQTYQYQLETGQAVLSSLSDGFEAFFLAVAKYGANAEQAFAAFAKAMGRSFLNSVASAIDAMIVEGTAGYLKNMLTGGIWMAAPTSAYSLPLLAALAATSGTLHGMAAMMAEGGFAFSPTPAIVGERKDRVPEMVTPLNRMDEVFERWNASQGGGKKQQKDQRPVVVTNDYRGAYILDSPYAERRAMQNLGRAMKRQAILR